MSTWLYAPRFHDLVNRGPSCDLSLVRLIDCALRGVLQPINLRRFPPTSKQEALAKSKEKLATTEAQCSALTEQRGFLENKLMILRKHIEKVQR